MTSPNARSIVLNADQEHAGLRAGVLFIVIGGFVIGFFVVSAILGSPLFDGSLVSAYAIPLSCGLALIAALAAAGAGEALMKRFWPSGRRVAIDDDGLLARLPEGKEVSLNWSSRVWAVKWYFALQGYPRGGRERRLTAQHVCVACQLQQDDARVIVYGYLKGAAAEEMLAGGDFHQINPADFYENNRLRRWRQAAERPQVPTNVLTGKEGPYWLAEQRRWTDGIELTGQDFVVFWQAIRERVEG